MPAFTNDLTQRISLVVFGGQTVVKVFRMVPLPVLSILLACAGWQHFLLVRNPGRTTQNLAATLLVHFLAIGFASAAILYHSRGWVVLLRKACGIIQ